MNQKRIPIEEARRLWRSRLTLPDYDMGDIVDPDTGKPYSRQLPISLSHLLFGYRIEELEADEENEE